MNREYSRRSPAVKRLMKEAQELHEPTEQYYAQPLEDNLFEWHFTVRGPPESDFDGGFYHGRIVLPPEYPMRPPSIMLLTGCASCLPAHQKLQELWLFKALSILERWPTGRFEVGTKICLSISGHHPETWQPSWSIRTVLLAIIGFMPTKGEGAIGALDYTPEERKVLARKSQDWKCSVCKVENKTILPKLTSSEKSKETQREAQEIAAQITFKKEEKKAPSDTSKGSTNDQGNQSQPLPQPENVGPMAPNPFGMFPNPQFPFQPGMFPFPPNFMGQGQMPFNPSAAPTLNPNVANQSQNNTQPDTSSPSAANNSNEQRTSTNATNQSSTSGSEVRQRSAPRRVSALPSTTTRTESSSSTSRTQNEPTTGGDTWAIVLIMIISLIISSLVARRLYVTYEYKFDDSPI